ncbi:MAG: hypothetical protein EHM28_05705 [Spirochaetaceae bacterium]|nr:MAG: hypothetical protein EHM28_05705 [Spirochaetaceae bacterium]
MKKYLVAISLVVCLTLPAFAEEAEPDDPDAMFPSIVLEIDDLSIEKIDVGIKDEVQLLPFEREAPLPDPAQIQVAEPQAAAIIPGALPPYTMGDKTFFTKVLFGAGLANSLMSEITFYRLGQQPVVKLFYSHDNSDGFAGHQVGLGYSTRQDLFEGSVKYQTPEFLFAASGGFSQTERGLQEQSTYFSVINQFSNGTVDLALKLGDLVTVSSATTFYSAGLQVTSGTHPAWTVTYPPLELSVSEKITGGLRWEVIQAALELSYSFRAIPGNSAYEMHRFNAKLDAGADIADWIRLDGEVGISTFTGTPYLVPFEVGVSGYAADWFSLRISGGYRVVPCNLQDLITEIPFADFPAELIDNHGWFGKAAIQFSFSNAILLVLEGTLSHNQAFATPAVTPDLATGLFPVVYTQNITVFETDSRLRFPIFSWLSIDAVLRLTIPFSGSLSMPGEIGGVLAAEEPGGGYGMSVSTFIKADASGTAGNPVLSAQAFFRAFDNITFFIEATDILSPLFEKPNFILAPYLTPGIQARFKIQISL